MRALLLAGLGGGIGSMLRFAATAALRQSALPAGWHHLATLAVNLAGCLAIGWLHAGWAVRPAGEGWRVFLVAGLLGGFTTFSAFGWETLQLLKQGRTAAALAYAAGSVALGLAAAALGLRLGR